MVYVLRYFALSITHKEGVIQVKIVNFNRKTTAFVRTIHVQNLKNFSCESKTKYEIQLCIETSISKSSVKADYFCVFHRNDTCLTKIDEPRTIFGAVIGSLLLSFLVRNKFRRKIKKKEKSTVSKKMKLFNVDTKQPSKESSKGKLFLTKINIPKKIINRNVKEKLFYFSSAY